MSVGKILGSCVYSIERFDNKHTYLLSRGRGLLFNTQTKSVEYKSPLLSNMSCFNMSKDKKRALLMNTSGKALLINTETEEVIHKFFLKYEPWHTSVIANENGFIYIDKSGDVICIDESNNFNQILKNPSNLTMRYLIYFDNGKFAVIGCDYEKDIIRIYVCDMQDSRLCVYDYIECVGKFGSDCDNMGDDLFLSVSVSCGEGSKIKIIKINISNGTVEDFIESVTFAAHKNDVLQKFSLSQDGNYIAMAYNDSVVIVSLKTKNIVNRFNFEFPSDVQWLDDDRCLVSTWNGLFEIKI